MYATKLIERVKPVWGCEPKNYTGAAMTAQYVSLKNYNHITFTILTGAWAGGTAAVSLLQATNISAGSAKALAFDTVWTCTSADDTLTKNTVSSNTFNLDTANKLYQIEIDAATLDISGGFICVTLVVASPGSNADL